MDRYLSIGTLAEMTETSESYWRKAIARRLLPVVKIGGGRSVRVRIADAEQFLRAHIRSEPHPSEPQGRHQVMPARVRPT